MSARKRSLFVLFGVGLVIIGALLFNSTKSGTKIGSEYYELERVNTLEKLQLGLSGRDSLGDNSGMVFVFPEVKDQCIWMKDMKFALDIIWLNVDKNIVAIEKEIRPETYPKQYCHGPAKYVIELNAGDVKSAKIEVGQSVNLNQP
ncbi:MAG TPA: DUF192 domain-containing protein [Candidatus Saccharibacteria bacterium]|nr:DUF192 domain-containing protein [Candidatus Saccharibacteria bacterium]